MATLRTSARRRRGRVRRARAHAVAVGLSALVVVPLSARAQPVPIRDLVRMDFDVPTRLVGYGIVVGLNGTGDRNVAQLGGGQTVRSIANLLRSLDITIPPEALRTRNAAAVLVTAEISPYLRAGGRFGVQVASLGDASSLRGGVLWMTPLISEIDGPAIATAQGPLVLSDGGVAAGAIGVETSARIPEGGLLDIDPAAPAFQNLDRLVLRTPDLGVAQLIVDAIETGVGAGTAAIEDPGSIRLTLASGDAAGRAQTLSRIASLTVSPTRTPRVVIDGRDGTVVAGGGISVGEAVVSHDGLTLAIDAAPPAAGGQAGQLRLAAGASIQDVAAALYAVGAAPRTLAAIFEALRDVGALSAELIVR
ncbi:MAG: flagellar basal body P-ring protein FlgI [Gemmatimonadetes bacterium]|nr:flagellar basal body P-ring protein FlgI [Gemmatimonadota bacterium]